MKNSETRKSYLLNKHVIITPGRAKRPRDVKEETVVKRTGKCPFCPEKIKGSEIRDKIENKKGEWQIVSLRNIYPAVSLKNKKAYGDQEVIIETPHHAKDLANLSEKQITLLLKMYARRTENMAKNKKLDYILCFKNQGSKAGASIVHAHSQVFATDLVPNELLEEAQAVAEYKLKKKTCPYCDIIKKEVKSSRKVFSDKNIAAFTPYASEYHYEVWVFPKRHVDNITELSEDELKSFAKALKKILKKLKALNLSFNYFLHNVVSNPNQHFYLKIQPRDSVWAGVELASGLVINSVPPEAAAEYFRK